MGGNSLNAIFQRDSNDQSWNGAALPSEDKSLIPEDKGLISEDNGPNSTDSSNTTSALSDASSRSLRPQDELTRRLAEVPSSTGFLPGIQENTGLSGSSLTYVVLLSCVMQVIYFYVGYRLYKRCKHQARRREQAIPRPCELEQVICQH